MRFKVFCLALFFASTIHAQGEFSKVPILHQQDIVIGADVYRLSVQEVIIRGEESFYYTLSDSKGDSSHFTMVDLSTGAYNLQVFTNLIRKELSSLGRHTRAKLEPIVSDLLQERIAGMPLELSGGDSILLEEVLSKAKMHYAYSTGEARQVLDTLIEVVAVNDSIRISNAVKQSAIDRQEQQNELERLLAPVSVGFLEAAKERLFRKNNQGPAVGKIVINDTVKVCECWPEPIKKRRKKKANSTQQGCLEKKCYDLFIDEVQLKFERGQIAGIKVEGVLNLTEGCWPIVFQNRYPISYSTKADVSQDFYTIGNSTLLYTPDERFTDYSVKLRDVFHNDYQFLNRTENYSSVDDTLTIRHGEVGRMLYKEPVTEVLQAKIFSDFVGLDNNQPNGLVQVEVSKRISMNTRTKSSNSRNLAYTYGGFFSYIEPNVMLTKLEDNNKVLDLGSDRTISSIRAFQFRNFSTGGHFNFVYMGHYRWHSAIRFDVGANIQRTALRWDTLTDASNVNAVSLLPRLSLDIYPHPNYGITFEYNWQFMRILDETIDSELPIPFFNIKNSIHRLGFIASVSLNEAASGQFFFRTQVNFSHRNPDQNFLQTQLGYAFSIFSRPPRPPVRNPLLTVN